MTPAVSKSSENTRSEGDVNQASRSKDHVAEIRGLTQDQAARHQAELLKKARKQMKIWGISATKKVSGR